MPTATRGYALAKHDARELGLGRARAGTPVVVLIADLDIRVINQTTGELLRHLTLDPTRGYQPRTTPQKHKDRT